MPGYPRRTDRKPPAPNTDIRARPGTLLSSGVPRGLQCCLVKAFLWVLGSLFVLDVVLVGVLAACATIVRRRGRPEERDPVTWWLLEGRRSHPRGLTPIPVSIGDGEPEPTPTHRARVRLVPVAAPTPQRPRRGVGGRRFAGIGLVAATILAGTAFASPQVRHFVASAIDAVSGGIGAGGLEPSDHVAGDPGAEPSDQSDASQATDAADPPTGKAPGDGAILGPALDPRPTGVQHTGDLTPASPTTVTAVPGGPGQIVLGWADVAGEDSYRIQRSSEGAGGWTTASVVGQDVTTFGDGELLPGATYFYRVIAANGDVESPPSDVVSATTAIDVPGSTSMTVLASSPDRIDLAWGDVAGETGYRIERSTDGGGGWTTIATTGQDVTSATDSDLQAGTTYWYRVFATNPAGDSAPSEAVSATTEPGPVAEDSSAIDDPVAV